MQLTGSKIFLRPLTGADVSPAYVKWMNDPDVTRFLESRFQRQTEEDIINFVKSVDGKKSILFGIFDLQTKSHIGNIKIGNINPHHKFGDLGLFVGEKSYWGKGYGTEAIKLTAQYAFETLKLNKLCASMYERASGSYRSFIKNGFREVGRYKRHMYCDGQYVDVILVERCRE